MSKVKSGGRAERFASSRTDSRLAGANVEGNSPGVRVRAKRAVVGGNVNEYRRNAGSLGPRARSRVGRVCY